MIERLDLTALGVLDKLAEILTLALMWLARPAIGHLLIAGIIVHGCVLVVVRHRTGGIDGYAFESLDCGEYYAIARNVAAHGIFSQSESLPLRHDTWRTPGYPLFLAVFIFLLGDSPVMLVVMQQVLSILNALLLFRIAGRWMGDRHAALAALLFLLEPYHLLYSTWLMATTLFVSVLLLTWYAWQRAIDGCHWAWFGLSGVLAGILALVRPIGVVVPPVLFLGFLVTHVRRSRQAASPRRRKPAWLGLGLFTILCVITVGSWMLRNQVVAGHFALSDQSGVVLAYFKATEVVLWREGRTEERYLETSLDPAKADRPHSVWDAIDERLRSRLTGLTDSQRAALTWRNLAQGNRTTVDSFEISRALRRIGWSQMAASPLGTLGCCLVRCGAILTFPLNLAIKPPAGVESNRLGSAAKGIPYLLLALWVLIRLVRRGAEFEQVYVPLAGTIALLLASTPQIDPRFRVPMIPLLVAIALLPRRDKM